MSSDDDIGDFLMWLTLDSCNKLNTETYQLEQLSRCNGYAICPYKNRYTPEIPSTLQAVTLSVK